MSSEERLYDGVYFAGGVSGCVSGARNEYEYAGGGRIIQIGMEHAVFIPPGAQATDLVGNAGVEYDAAGMVINERFWCPEMTVEEALQAGPDITAVVLRYIEFTG